MASWFVDLDGSVFKFGSNELLPGALEFLKKLDREGHQIIFTTRRGSDWPDEHIFGRQSTLKFLRGLGIRYQILFDIDSPRIVINDSGAYGINVEQNKTNFDEIYNDLLKGKYQ